jgi:hypothetical protein
MITANTIKNINCMLDLQPDKFGILLDRSVVRELLAEIAHLRSESAHRKEVGRE